VTAGPGTLVQAIAIEILRHAEREVAERIHAVQLAAYAQEAELLQVASFPPLQRKVEDIQRSADRFFGACIGGALAGVVGIERSAVRSTLWISSLTVAPPYQRRGVARASLSAVLAQEEAEAVMVSTDIRNEPALALYAGFGFVPVNHRTVDGGRFELVELRRRRDP